jgi:hypothetical protein
MHSLKVFSSYLLREIQLVFEVVLAAMNDDTQGAAAARDWRELAKKLRTRAETSRLP